MNRCEQARELLADWVSGRLDDPSVAVHVASCPDCAAAAEEWRAMEAMLALELAPAPDDAPPWLAETIVRAVYAEGERESAAGRLRARYAAWAAGLISLVVLGAVLVVWQRGSGSGAPSVGWFSVMIWITLGVAVCYGFLSAEIDWAGLLHAGRRRLS
jgi:anti-sigma factor RsiW